MKYILSITLLTTFFLNLSFAQVNYKITSYNPTAQVFKNLLQTNSQIEANDSVNEEILDLVTPIVADSLLGRKKEHHQLFLVGWLIHAFGGFNWRSISMHKEKFVGTVHSDGRSGEEQFTEYDIKYHLKFHLIRFFDLAV